MVSVPAIGALPQKPRLRGVSHQVAFFASLLATVWLVATSPAGAPRIASLVYGASVAFLFGVSSLYHRVNWRPAARQRMRRLDHAAIFVMIAGGYTPLFALVPSSDGSRTALFVVWVGAAIGVTKSLLWPGAPKWVAAVLAVAVGWAVVVPVVQRVHAAGGLAIALLVASGCVYSAGAAVYALKRPDPAPRTFGYHEVFHALVVAATVLLFAHVLLVRTRS